MIQYGFDKSENRYLLGDVEEILKDPGMSMGKMIAIIFANSDKTTRVTVDYSDGSIGIFEKLPEEDEVTDD